jgi:hypothetical protein
MNRLRTCKKLPLALVHCVFWTNSAEYVHVHLYYHTAATLHAVMLCAHSAHCSPHVTRTPCISCLPGLSLPWRKWPNGSWLLRGCSCSVNWTEGVARTGKKSSRKRFPPHVKIQRLPMFGRRDEDDVLTHACSTYEYRRRPACCCMYTRTAA